MWNDTCTTVPTSLWLIRLDEDWTGASSPGCNSERWVKKEDREGKPLVSENLWRGFSSQREPTCSDWYISVLSAHGASGCWGTMFGFSALSNTTYYGQLNNHLTGDVCCCWGITELITHWSMQRISSCVFLNTLLVVNVRLITFLNLVEGLSTPVMSELSGAGAV